MVFPLAADGVPLVLEPLDDGALFHSLPQLGQNDLCDHCFPFATGGEGEPTPLRLSRQAFNVTASAPPGGCWR